MDGMEPRAKVSETEPGLPFLFETGRLLGGPCTTSKILKDRLKLSLAHDLARGPIENNPPYLPGPSPQM